MYLKYLKFDLWLENKQFQDHWFKWRKKLMQVLEETYYEIVCEPIHEHGPGNICVTEKSEQEMPTCFLKKKKKYLHGKIVLNNIKRSFIIEKSVIWDAIFSTPIKVTHITSKINVMIWEKYQEAIKQEEKHIKNTKAIVSCSFSILIKA